MQFFRQIACCLLLIGIFLNPGVSFAGDLTTRQVSGSDFQAASDALIEAIEAEGLVVSARIPFNLMLERTAAAVERKASPFSNVEVVQFCSSLLAWQLLEEEAAQVALNRLAKGYRLRFIKLQARQEKCF